MRRKTAKTIVVFVLFSGAAFFVLRFLTINEVRCISQYGKCPEIIEAYLADVKGKSYLSTRSSINKSIAEDVKVKDFRVRFQLPPSFTVYINERKATIALKTLDDKYILLDDEGVELGAVSDTELPVIELETNEFKKEELLFEADLVRELHQYYDVNTALLRSDGLYVIFEDRLEAIFPQEGSLDVLLGSVDLLLFQLNRIAQEPTIETEGKKISQIDFRYKNPVLR